MFIFVATLCLWNRSRYTVVECYIVLYFKNHFEVLLLISHATLYIYSTSHLKANIVLLTPLLHSRYAFAYLIMLHNVIWCVFLLGNTVTLFLYPDRYPFTSNQLLPKPGYMHVKLIGWDIFTQQDDISQGQHFAPLPHETFDWSALSQPAGDRKELRDPWTVIGSSLSDKYRSKESETEC